MKKVFLLLIGATIALACAGDCLSCHPVLKPGILSDDHHRVMLSCVQCHSAESANPNAPCGGNCFACHAPSAIPQNIDQHRTLPGCRECHVGVSDGGYFRFGFDGNPVQSPGILGPLNQIINGE